MTGNIPYQSNELLSKDQQKQNARWLANNMRERGYSLNSIAGILGNWESESTLNPGIYQRGTTTGGLGLAQWTPWKKKLMWYCNYIGISESSMEQSITNPNIQLDYQDYECINGLKGDKSKKTWYNNHGFSYRWDEFKTSTDSPEKLAEAYYWQYERSGANNPGSRPQKARQWYDFLQQEVSVMPENNFILEKDLIDLFKTMYEEHWKYEWGAARKGCVDCSGAFVYAYKKLNGPEILHSSNAIPRYSCGKILPISKAKPGYVALKWREQTDPHLIDKYGKDDYYHIGLVDETGKYVLNAKGTSYGFVREKLEGAGWDYVAPLDAVVYSPHGGLYTARVQTQEGKLRVRAEPTTDSEKLTSISSGQLVSVLEETNSEWSKIEYQGIIGYCASAYLVRTDDPVPPSGDTVTITMPKEMALELYELIGKQLVD